MTTTRVTSTKCYPYTYLQHCFASFRWTRCFNMVNVYQSSTNLAVDGATEVSTDHRREVAVLGFPGTEAALRPAETVALRRGTPAAGDKLSASTRTAHDDTARCRQRSADSSTSCTSWECVAPPGQHWLNCTHASTEKSYCIAEVLNFFTR